jgi:hypothetical protein
MSRRQAQLLEDIRSGAFELRHVTPNKKEKRSSCPPMSFQNAGYRDWDFLDPRARLVDELNSGAFGKQNLHPVSFPKFSSEGQENPFLRLFEMLSFDLSSVSLLLNLLRFS